MANINEQKSFGKDGLIYLWQQLKAKLAGKVDVEAGKGLSTNDYTTAEKDKLAGIAAGATKNTVENVLTSDSATNALSAAQGKALDGKIKALSDSMGELGYGDMLKATYDADNDGKVDSALHADSADMATNAGNATKAADADKLGGQLPAFYAKAADIPTVPTNVGAFTNDAGYLTEHQDISGKLDKTGDGSAVTVTFTPASARTNVATGDKLSAILGKVSKFFADLKPVAFTGAYEDLTGKPAIPVVTNDLTDELKGQYDAAYTHAQAAHAPANAQANIIEAVQVNGSAVAPVGKAVNITVPTAVSQLSDAANYALKTDLTNVYKYKGSVAAFDDLPADGNTAGDVYNVESDGMNWGWNGAAWDNLGSIYTMEFITNAEIDAILAM